MNNINFCGKFFLRQYEINQLPIGQKSQLVKYKKRIIDTYCQKETPVIKQQNGYIFNINDGKESAFQKIMDRFGIYIKKI